MLKEREKIYVDGSKLNKKNYQDSNATRKDWK